MGIFVLAEVCANNYVTVLVSFPVRIRCTIVPRVSRPATTCGHSFWLNEQNRGAIADSVQRVVQG